MRAEALPGFLEPYWHVPGVRYATMAALLLLGVLLARRALADRLTATSLRHVREVADDIAQGRSGAAVNILRLSDKPGTLPVSQLRRAGMRIEGAAGGLDPDAVAAVSAMLDTAHAVGASDVHLAPDPEGAQITFRVDGMLYDVCRVPKLALPLVISRVKVAAGMSIYARDEPQDGRLMMAFQDRSAEVRVSVLPTSHGEKIVMRLHHASAESYDLERLGLQEEMLLETFHLLARPQGLLFLTGPTGSGKTTTIYSALRHISATRGALTNIVTIEDPIEFDVPGAAQTQVNPATGLTFADGLRSILRQDPDVIVVGEIRDTETAKIALQAGLSGHLILTTIHAESAAGVFTRLTNMGIEPFMLASATIGVLSQRLVRRNCPTCCSDSATTATQARLLARLGATDTDGSTFQKGTGCEACLGKGLLGRTGLYELMTITEELRDVITGNVPTGRIHAAAIETGMKTLLQDGLDKASNGELPLDEVLRVAT